METYDMAVIGAGTGGLTAASGARSLGAKVALIEKDKLGGECLWTGCVPSKALIRSTKVISLMHRAPEFGLDRPEVRFDFGHIMHSMRQAMAGVGKHDDPEKFRERGIDVIYGAARFASPRRLEVDGRALEAKRIVIATGSRTAVPPVEGLKEAGFIDHVGAFALERLPRSMVILGGGPIGLEIAQIFRRFGAEITVVEMMDQLLPREDKEVADVLQRLLEAEGIQVLTRTKALKAERTAEGKTITVETRDGQRQILKAEEILIATGRRPNIEDLNLEAAGVQTNKQGIVVDDKLRATQKNIFAVGDVTGKFLFTHVAEYQARLVVRNAFFPLVAGKADYRVVPWATFTDPEVARVGMTEEAARQTYGNVKAFRYPFQDLDRSIIDRETAGFIKIVCKSNGEILGGHILGSEGGELVQMMVLAMREGIKIGSLSRQIRLYPTLSEGMLRAADFYYREKIAEWKQKLQPLLRWFGK